MLLTHRGRSRLPKGVTGSNPKGDFRTEEKKCSCTKNSPVCRFFASATGWGVTIATESAGLQPEAAEPPTLGAFSSPGEDLTPSLENP